MNLDTMANAAKLVGVTKTFGEKVAVDALDLTVPRGTIYGFIGPNGSGKTTTLRMIMRILHPDGGSVEVLGEDATGGGAASDRIGYLPENAPLYPEMSVQAPKHDRRLAQIPASEKPIRFTAFGTHRFESQSAMKPL